MIVRDLISLLHSCDPGAEIRIAHQPHWPFSYTVSTVVSDADIRRLHDPGWRGAESRSVWLVEGAIDSAISDAIWRTAVKKRGGD